jgi:hypothetical protein
MHLFNMAIRPEGQSVGGQPRAFLQNLGFADCQRRAYREFCPCTEESIVHASRTTMFYEQNLRVIARRPATANDLSPSR